jgi:hypothetical protein
LGAGLPAVQNYGSITIEVEILRYGRKPRNKGGRPKKIDLEAMYRIASDINQG